MMCRLNRMNDEGCKAIFDSLKTNGSLERLNMGANNAGREAAASLNLLLRVNTAITELDVSCNSGFGQDGCEALRRAIEVNTTVQLMDLRACGGNPDDEFAIAENLRARQERKERTKVLNRGS